MKINQMYDELMQTAKQIGITVRKENGKFRSGACIVNTSEVIVLNKTAPIEVTSSVLAQCLKPHTENIYVKPVVRDYIDRESRSAADRGELQLEVKY
jgi:hypothetical protein